MDDTPFCPICKNKLKTVRTGSRYLINKKAVFIERVCNGINHALQLLSDESTGQIDLLRFSLNSNYSTYLEVDFVNNKCYILCVKDGHVKYIEILKMFELDFPDLTKLKEKIAMLVAFS